MVLPLIALLALTSSFNWTAVGPERGSITAIAVGETTFAGTAQGRLFRLQGDAWQPAGEFAAPVERIVVPPSRTWLLAGGELRRMSEDIWPRVTSGINSFAVAPADDDVLYAATDSLLLVSIDGGTTWQTREGGGVSVTVDAANPQVVWIARPSGALEKSVDGGATWTPPSDVAEPIRSVTAHPRRAGTAYAIGDDGRGFRTTDGTNWTQLYFLTGTLTFEPDDDRSFYAVDDAGRLFHSDDDGDWLDTIHGGPILSLDIDRHSGALYAGFREHGVLRSDDGGQTWVPSRSGIFAAEIHTLAASADASVVYAGSVNGMFRSTDRGANWDYVFTLRILPGPFTAIAIDDLDPQRVWMGADISFWYSSDGGNRFNRLFWIPEKEGMEAITAAEFDRADRRVVWLLMTRSLFRVENDVSLAVTISDRSPAVEPEDGFDVLATDPHDAQRLWIGGTRGGGALLLRSDDAGLTWRDMTERVSAHGAISALHVDRSSGSVFAGTSTGRVLRSDDGGETWQTSDEGLRSAGEITAIASNGVALFAAGQGVFMSNDRRTWRNVTGAIGGERVTALTSSDVVFAGTAGSGVFVQRPLRTRPRAAGR